MLIIGLTGGIASGKSTVSKRLKEEYGMPVVDADRIAHEIVEPGKPAYKKIVAYFSSKVPGLVKEDGTLERKKLGGYVFSHKDDLAVLNSYTHPEVRKEMLRQVARHWLSAEKMCVLDVPLLFEAGMDRLCGLIICVVCPEEEQLHRMAERNPTWTRQECLDRIHNQMSNEERARRADIVLENQGTVEELYAKLDAEVRRIEPGTLRTYLELSPIGVLSACYCLIKNTYRSAK